ncbi:MAG: hypothetical protein ACLFP8_09245 [Alphaproteobacteria bacterium]
MKKTVATFCLIGATLGLSACSSMNDGRTEVKEKYERTAPHGEETTISTPSRVAPAEKVFRRAQTK